MRRYIEHLRTRPDHHQKRFAFLVSGLFTMLMFTTWTMVNFGLPAGQAGGNGVMARESNPDYIASDDNTPTPVESLSQNMAAAWGAITGGLSEAKKGLESIDVGDGYVQVRNEALENTTTGQVIYTNGQ